MHLMVAEGREVGIRDLSRFPLHLFPWSLMCLGLFGSTSTGFDCSGDMCLAGKGTFYQYVTDEGSSAGFECLLTLDHGRDFHLNERECHDGGISKEAWGHRLSGHVWARLENSQLVEAAHGHYNDQLCSREEKHFGIPVLLSRSCYSHRVVSSSLGV